MDSRIQETWCQTGFSLVETMISVALLMVAIIGTSSFKYYAFLNDRQASRQVTAARIGLMLCESWRGLGGDESYDPVTYLSSDLTIAEDTGPDEPEDFILLGSYTITLNGVTYYTTLSWKEVVTGLNALNTIVAWAQREEGESSLGDTDKSFALTSYANVASAMDDDD